jgi:predicted small lipoprotein YifL
VSRSDRPVLRVAAASVLLLTLGLMLGACGRKGPLDPPPGSQPQPQSSAQQTGSTPPASGLMSDQQKRDVAPPGQNRRLLIDGLLD